MEFLQSVSVLAVILTIVGIIIVVAAWVTFFQMGADLRRTRMELEIIREILRADYDERHQRT